MKKISTTMSARGELIRRMESNDLLQGLSQEIYYFLADMSEVYTYDGGEVLVELNEPSHTFYLMVEGHAAVLLDGGQEVAELGPSDGFGEVGLLLELARSATVVAKDAVTVMCISKDHFFQCFDRFSEFGRMMSLVLARRLSDTLTKVPSMTPDLDMPSVDVLQLLPQPFVQRSRILPLSITGNRLVVGFVDEPSTEMIERVRQFLPSMELEVCSISSSFFNKGKIGKLIMLLANNSVFGISPSL